MGELNETAISIEGVREAKNKIKLGNVLVQNGCLVSCLKEGCIAVLEWLVRLLNESFDMGVVPKGLFGTCMVPPYKGKSDKCEFSKLRLCNLMRVWG